MKSVEQLITEVSTRYNPISKFFIGILLFPIFLIYSLTNAFYIIFANPYYSFNHQSERAEQGTYKISYTEHVVYKKKTRLFSVSSLIIIIIGVIAIEIASSALF